ncbi:MAG: hypothetical protein MUD14_16980 [Hydrococcus sp. Prado102]|jgi:hypothetical protein|nr:hypothetical protein [Hydrococcus sp. Prado102]
MLNLSKTTINQTTGTMSKYYSKKRLGEILEDAGLVSPAQIEIALQDQSIYEDMRIGEILALRGWLKQETADFFVEKWPALKKQQNKKPLGIYLKEAALLDETQIKMLLAEQVRMTTPRVRFGKLVVLKGWLKQSTVDFFLDNLSARAEQDKVYISQTVLKTLSNHPFQHK